MCFPINIILLDQAMDMLFYNMNSADLFLLSQAGRSKLTVCSKSWQRLQSLVLLKKINSKKQMSGF